MAGRWRSILALGLLFSFSYPGVAAFASETISYAYDVRGRIVKVSRSGTINNGTTSCYRYDRADNRQNVSVAIASDCSGVPPPSTTIQLTSGSGKNLRTVANQNGYTGASGVSYTFVVGNSVTITGSSGGGMAIDTGPWPTGVTLALNVNSGGIVRGGGGNGGNGGSGTTPGVAGGAGGDAIRCNAPIAISVNGGGTVQGGGGGGGGGSGAISPSPGGTINIPGSGGGGGAPNGSGGAGGVGTNAIGGPGSPGTATGGGAGGNLNGPAGGAGGGYGAAGSPGTAAYSPAVAGGGTGYAVRKNGTGCTLTNSGTVTGPVG